VWDKNSKNYRSRPLSAGDPPGPLILNSSKGKNNIYYSALYDNTCEHLKDDLHQDKLAKKPEEGKRKIFLLELMGVLAPGLHTFDVSARPSVNTSENFTARVSAESPLNISSNLSEVISEVLKA
jgi:hypothetical protein